MAYKRLESTAKKLKAEGYFEEYDKVLREWMAEGIIVQVPESEAQNFGHYLPHRHVVKLGSNTTRIRPVFDASAKEKGHSSLNLSLEKGPNLIELIPRVLTKFRRGKFGVIADIRKAFLQISIRARDRDFLRFFWFDEETKERVEIYRHCRVVIGVSCSTFLLGAVIELHIQKTLQSKDRDTCSEETLLKLSNSFYVDDCITSVDSSKELSNFINESIAIMASGGFDLRGWEYTGMSGDSEETKALGVVWNKTDDTLRITSTLMHALPQVLTKRTILATAHAVFDPIGFSCPVMLCPKLILQETWSSKIDWDTQVNEDIKTRFITWFQELRYISEGKISRHMCKGLDKPRLVSLHTFCDASRLAYPAVVFIRIKTEQSVVVQLLQAKARVAPKKETTISRLELLAAIIGTRLVISVKEALDFDDIAIYLWSDSTTVLSWIRKESNWGIFVWNRVQEIRRLSNVENWRHVMGEMNLADLPSRGCTVKQLIASKWWEGPEWLYRSSEEWPVTDFLPNEEEINRELKKSTVTSMLTIADRQENQLDCDWYTRQYSKYYKIIRLVAWIKRFVYNCRCTREERRKEELSFDEITQAETVVMKMVQLESFKGHTDPRIRSLNVFTSEDGLLRVDTKISSRQDEYSFRCPIVLPSQHVIVKRLIEKRHEDLCHAGVQTVMSNIREQFWISGGRRTIRSVINKCVACKRQNSKSFESSPVSLPRDRVKDAVVFGISGVDFAGPVFLIDRKKALICLFTCAVYRAVHLELVTSLSTTAFLEAFRRFVARRGRPHTMYSDNGINFVGAGNLLRKINWKKVIDYSTTQRVNWKLIRQQLHGEVVGGNAS